MRFRRKPEPNGHRLPKPKLEKIVLRLYVTGQTPRSVRAVQNLHKFCAAFLRNRFELEVVDIYQQPALAQEMQIVAAPTLVKTMPLPARRLVGDFSDEQRMLSALDLRGASGQG